MSVYECLLTKLSSAALPPPGPYDNDDDDAGPDGGGMPAIPGAAGDKVPVWETSRKTAKRGSEKQ